MAKARKSRPTRRLRPAKPGRQTARIAVIGNGPLARAVARQDKLSAHAHDGQAAMALANSGARRADLVVVDAGDDAGTIALLQTLLAATAMRGGPQIVANVGDRRLRHAAQLRLEHEARHPRPVLVSAPELAAERFMAREQLFEMAHWRSQPRLHVMLVGFGLLAEALLDEIVTAGIAGNLAKPLIRILAAEPEQVRASLKREMPEIGASAEIIVADYEREMLADPVRSPIATAEQDGPLTAILLAHEDAAQTLGAVAAIAELQNRHGRGLAALFIGGAGHKEACGLIAPKRPPQNLARRIAEIDDIDAIDALLDHILTGRDVLARRIHESYRAEFAGQTAGGADWDALSETYRRANRRAGAHLPQKLWTLGLGVPAGLKDFGAIDPDTFATLITPIAQSAVEDDTIRRLARLEHERWCADRRLDGWEHGEARDDFRRRHPNLVAFDDPRLSAGDIAKDVSQIRFLFRSVVRPAKNGAATRLAIGIVENLGGQQAGISLASMRERTGAERHRSIVLLSPLLSARELAATRALIGDLDKAKRGWQLVVPEWFPDNKTSRDPALLKDRAFIELMGRATTLIAPVGPPGLFADDVWEDPIESQAATDALKRYVSERADTIVAAESAEP